MAKSSCTVHMCAENYVNVELCVLCTTFYIQIKWPDAECRLGNTFTISRINSVRKFSWDGSPNSYYTLLVVDLDPLGRDNPLLSEVRYWAVGNTDSCDFDAGEVIYDYLPPTPIYDTPPHRFVYLFYKRSSPMNFEESFIKSTWVLIFGISCVID